MYQRQFPRRSFLKAAGGAVLGPSLLRSQSVLPSQSAAPPNVVLILCDDLGFGDVHSYGSSIATPNIDGMAQEGVRFQQFYSASNVCSPSRAALLTGQYQTRVGVPDVLTPTSTTGLSLSAKTIAEVLKPLNYKTMCVGKWHLGTEPQFLPTSRGFDHYYGIPYSNDQSPSILMQDTMVIESPVVLNTLTQQYTQQATNFISSASGSPFFLYMAHTFPHIPLAASNAFLGQSGLGLYGDVIEEIDWSVGQVLQSLQANGVDNNTLVIFTSDNGPWYLGSAGKLRGRKGWSYEGGVREPFIARFPGRIPASSRRGGVSAGRSTQSVATTMDLMPTIAALCGAPLPTGNGPLDGVNIWPVLAEQQADVPHPIFLYFDSWNMQCARMGDWKLHVSRYNTFAWSPDPVGGRVNLPLPNPELYNLALDPDESYDCAADFPGIVAQIQAGIQKMLPTFPAQVLSTYNSTMAIPSFATDGALPVELTPSCQ
jgi:arylsulfatase A